MSFGALKYYKMPLGRYGRYKNPNATWFVRGKSKLTTQSFRILAN
jgi:hypothetical protein